MIKGNPYRLAILVGSIVPHGSVSLFQCYGDWASAGTCGQVALVRQRLTSRQDKYNKVLKSFNEYLYAQEWMILNIFDTLNYPIRIIIVRK